MKLSIKTADMVVNSLVGNPNSEINVPEFIQAKEGEEAELAAVLMFYISGKCAEKGYQLLAHLESAGLKVISLGEDTPEGWYAVPQPTEE